MNILGISLIIENENGETIDLYDDPEVALTSTTGFGFEGEINTVSNYDTDGSTYVNTHVPERNIGFTVRYKNIPDAEAAKLRLQGVFAPRQRLKIQLKTPHVDAYIYGYCESCDTPPNAYPMTTAISIVCPDPWWNSTGKDEEVIEFEGTEGDIYYPGSSPTGFITELYFTSDAVWVKMDTNGSIFTSDNSISGGSGWTDPITKYISGSKVIIDSRLGDKSVRYYSNPSSTKGSERFTTTKVGELYPVLNPGDNHISITSDGTFTVRIRYSVKNQAV